MLKSILPLKVLHALDFLNLDKLNEIRIRANNPIVIDYGGRYFLGENGIAEEEKEALVLNEREIADIVFKACECSVYAHNEELKQGYLTLANGIRIGLCGEAVYNENSIKTLKNFSSLNIRIPHLIKNCSLKALPYLHNENGVLNTLIIAPPSAGKTTFLRDFSTQISDKMIAKNILIVDERNEICASNCGKRNLYCGKFVDVYSYTSKEFAVINGIRVMAPEVILLDEISCKQDIEALLNLVGAGVNFVATTHAKNLNDLNCKPIFKDFLKLGVIDRFVVLSNRNGAGTVEGIWNKDEVCLYCEG